MRTVTSTLLAAQKASRKEPIWKVALTDNGNSYTYYGKKTDVTSRIKEIELIEEDDRQAATIILANSDKVVSAIDLKGFQCVISSGMTTSSGDEYSDHAPMYVIGQQMHSWRGGLAISLSAIGIPNTLSKDEASEAYRPEDDDTDTVKTLFRKIAGDTGVTILTCYSHCKSYDVTFDSEDSLIDSFIPADSFQISFKDNRLSKFKELLAYTGCVMRFEDDGDIHIFVPTVSTTTQWAASTAYSLNDTVIPTTANEVEYICTTAGTSGASEPTWPTEVADTVTDGSVVWTVSYDYDYRLESGYHTFFEEMYRKRVVIPGYIEVESSGESGDSYTGYAQDDYYSSLPTALQKREHKRLRVTSNAQCTAIATAILSQYQRECERGSGTVPMNVGAEIHDFVKIKDTRLDDYRVGNMGYIRWHYVPEVSTMEFRFGKLGIGTPGALPIISTTGETNITNIINEISEIWNAINEIINIINEILENRDKFRCIYFYDKNDAFIGSICALAASDSVPQEIHFVAHAAGSNIRMYASSATGGLAIGAGGLASEPVDGEILLDPSVHTKAETAFIVPEL